MIVRKGITALLLTVGLAVGPAGNAEIYRWVDEQGNVNFGDCPPARCGSEVVQSTSGPSEEAMREARERARRLQDYQQSQASERRESKAVTTESEGVGRPPVGSPADIPCFASLADTWGLLISDSREGPRRKPLRDAEYRGLRGLLKSLEGGREGTIRETFCIRPDAAPPSKVHNHEVDWKGRWQSDRVFRVRAELLGRETKAVAVEFFSFLWSRQGLRFRKAQTDISFQLDQPGNDAGIVALTSRSLTFYWRRGGPLRRTKVIAISRAGQGISMREFAYTQGVLSGKRVWTIGR